ncbi:sporulation protein YabP [Pseudogracilibacillus sp. SO30301A]|uniref:sporulation protein YabP n=1 Tax=Pseudogracilibacillus sp. SO30301A TaxID=3098291 RepID=UPI00300E3E1E
MNYYERVENITVQKEHRVSINNRKELEIKGVKEIDSFDNEEFLLETNMGYLIVRGQNLQLKNLNVEEGIVQIQGKVYELTYVDEQQQEKAKGLFSRLFR